MEISNILNDAYYAKAQSQIDYLGSSGSITSSKHRYLRKYLTKTKLLQNEWKIDGYSPWKKRLLGDRREVLDAFFNDFLNAREMNKAYNVPDENFFSKMSQSIDKGVASGAYNNDETGFLKNYLYRTKVIQSQFARGGLSNFERSILGWRMKFFQRVMNVYAAKDYNPRTTLKG